MTDYSEQPGGSSGISDIAIAAGEWLAGHHQFLATVESCTGGGIAQAITSVAGSSGWFERGFVTYSNESKLQLVGVRPQTLDRFGAVSEQVAGEMATGGLKCSNATVCLSVTGIAGPDGGSPEKPVGMICFGLAQKSGLTTITQHFKGDRQQIRDQAIKFALQWLMN